ncbi:MAG: phosphotyrosine protein phosphatase [Marinomonas sp.]
MIRRYLFVCGKNRQRSPTAEQLFSQFDGLDVLSAGIRRDSDEQLNGELVEWADMIFVMEKRQLTFVQSNFREQLLGTQVINLSIPDRFEFMEDELVDLLRVKMKRFLP